MLSLVVDCIREFAVVEQHLRRYRTASVRRSQSVGAVGCVETRDFN